MEREGGDVPRRRCGPRTATLRRGAGLGARRRARATSTTGRRPGLGRRRRSASRPSVSGRRCADVDVGSGGRPGPGGRDAAAAPPTRPVHAYLLVGPRGSGIETAARCFAALLIGADGDDRVLRGRHPDVVEFRPVATMYSVERDVRDAILPAVHASPIETERKCVVLLEADRLNPESSNTLAQEHRGAAAAHDHHPGRRVRGRAARHDPVALPADRLRRAGHRGAARGARAPGRPRRRGRGSPPRSPVAGSTARSRSPARSPGCATRSPTSRAASTAPARPRSRWPKGSSEVDQGHARRARDGAGGRARRARGRDRAPAVLRPHRAGDAQARHRPPEARGAARSRIDACSKASPRSSRCTATRSPSRRAAAQRSTASGSWCDPAAAAEALDACREARGRVRVQSERGPAARAAAAPSPGRCASSAPRLNSPPAGIAQSVEQLTRNEQVRSSNLLPGSRRRCGVAGGGTQTVSVSARRACLASQGHGTAHIGGVPRCQ